MTRVNGDKPKLHGRANLVIRASAGTGKTYTLSSRYLSLLRRGVGADTILATTFTRKAAGEILERVLTRLADAGLTEDKAKELARDLNDPGLGVEECRAMLAGLCRELHRTSISTIDSFFHGMAMCFRHELGISPGVAVVDDRSPTAVQLRSRAIDAMLGDHDPGVLVDLLRRLHHDKARRLVTGAIDNIVSEMYGVYQDTFGEESVWSQLEEPKTLTRVEVAELMAAMDVFIEQPPDKNFAKALHNNRAAALADDWRGFLGSGLGKVVHEGRTDFSRKDIPEPMLEVFIALVAHARAVEVGYVARQTKATYELLKRFDEHYARLRATNHVMLYSDIALKLAGGLCEREGLLEDLYYRMDGRVQHLMLDEFQDTSSLQWRILRPIASEIASYGDEDAMRTFFCVGDTKQAIYGWRGGSAAIFGQIEQELHLDQDSKKTLSSSWRSSQVVLDAVNQVFGNLDSCEGLAKWPGIVDGWKMQYQAHTAKKDLSGYVELRTTRGVEEGEDAKLVHEQCVAEHVKRIVEDCRGRSVGVLVRRNDKVRRMVAALRELGIEASGEGANPLTDDPAVAVILSAMLLADHPGNRVAGFHVFHSPLGMIVGLESDGEADRFKTGAAIRRRLLCEGYSKVVSDWAKQLAGHCNEQSAARLGQLIELGDGYDGNLTLRPGHFVDYVKQTNVEQISRSGVRVMTIHKSKGLEFDVVVMSDLQKSMSWMQPTATCVYRHEASGPIDAVFRGTNQMVRDASELLAEAYEQERCRRIDDNLNGLYVGMTRARHGLYLFAQPYALTGSGRLSTRGNAADCDAVVIRHGFGVEDEKVGVEQLLYRGGDEKWYEKMAGGEGEAGEVEGGETEQVVELKMASDLPRRFVPRATPSSLEDAGRIRVENILDMTTRQAAVRGSVIHGMFELVDWLDGGCELNDERLLEVAKRIGREMDSAWREKQVADFRKMINRQAVREALSRSGYGGDSESLDLWRERPFAVHLDGQLLTGVFDRAVVERVDGQPVRAEVIDFKTDWVEEDQGNLAGLVERYRPQMEAYCKALSRILKLDREHIRARLLFVSAGIPCVIE